MEHTIITFEPSDFEYMILNLIGHDVIHDFKGLSSKRWITSIKLIEEMYSPTQLGGKENVVKQNDIITLKQINKITPTDIITDIKNVVQNKNVSTKKSAASVIRPEHQLFFDELIVDCSVDILFTALKNAVYKNGKLSVLHDEPDFLFLNDFYKTLDLDIPAKTFENFITGLIKKLKTDNLSVKLIKYALSTKQNTKVGGVIEPSPVKRTLRNRNALKVPNRFLNGFKNSSPKKTAKKRTDKKTTTKYSDASKSFVHSFVRFIAKTALHSVYGLEKYKSDNAFTNTQIQLLHEVYTKGTDGYNDIDTRLNAYFRKHSLNITHGIQFASQEELIDQLNNPSVTNLYINNGIISYIKRPLCAISSVLDGFRGCNLDSKTLENGNMHFSLRPLNYENTKYTYDGRLELTSKKSSEYTNSIKIITKNLTLVSSYSIYADDFIASTLDKMTTENILFTERNLHAVNIAGQTVKKLYDFIQPHLDEVMESNFFDTVFEKRGGIELVLGTILFKGTGDFYQEIRAVSLNGAYTGTPTYRKKFSDTFDITVKNPSVCFLANDRPSGTRFAFMLLRGLTGINHNAYGGFYGSNETSVLVKYSSVNIRTKNPKKRKKTSAST